MVFLPIKLVVQCAHLLKHTEMSLYSPQQSLARATGFVMQPPMHRPDIRIQRWQLLALTVVALLLCANLIWMSLQEVRSLPLFSGVRKPLYLIEKAAHYVQDTSGFEAKVRDISHALNVPPEWLMAVIHHESRFDPRIRNMRGSGATGLLQFMVPAVRDLNDRMGTRYYMRDIQQMSAIDQLDLVYEYLQTVRERYGEFERLSDLYLAVLYPRALEQDPCYTLFSKPSKTYSQNAGLDEDRDGSITIKDIERRFKRMYPVAYRVDK
ncbi:MAG: hypothetical protein OHK0039_36230 [Bacteroidia bacterium]